jgi:rhodanese-related sulfurtransferase
MEAKSLAREISLIIIVSFVIGAAVNLSLVRRFIAGEFRQGFIDREKYSGIRFITLAEAEELFAGGAAVFIDSRTRAEFASGHIPGALNLPLGEVKETDNLVDSLGREPFPLSPERTLVVYCEGEDCQTSVALAKLIHGRGLRDIRIPMGGWAEWREAGLPVEKSP